MNPQVGKMSILKITSIEQHLDTVVYNDQSEFLVFFIIFTCILCSLHCHDNVIYLFLFIIFLVMYSCK